MHSIQCYVISHPLRPNKKKLPHSLLAIASLGGSRVHSINVSDLSFSFWRSILLACLSGIRRIVRVEKPNSNRSAHRTNPDYCSIPTTSHSEYGPTHNRTLLYIKILTLTIILCAVGCFAVCTYYRRVYILRVQRENWKNPIMKYE